MSSLRLPLDSALDPRPEAAVRQSAAPPAQDMSLSRERYSRIARLALIGYAATAAISVALSQIILFPLVAYWVAISLFEFRGRLSLQRRPFSVLGASLFTVPLAAPIAAWFAVCLLSSFWGANPGHSLAETGKGLAVLLLPFAVASALLWDRSSLERSATSILCALVGGQTIAAMHTIFSSGAGIPLPQKVPGAVTESGQLVLVLPIALLFAMRSWKGSSAVDGAGERFRTGEAALLLISAIVLVASWPFSERSMFAAVTAAISGATICAAALLPFAGRPRSGAHFSAAALLSPETTDERKRAGRVIAAALTLLLAAFLFNLKRGPWLGMFIEATVIGALFSRRLLLWTAGGALFLFLALQPVRARLEGSVEDFSIQGGRQNMWAMGADLVQSYPLGLGFGNSKMMRVLDPTLPPEHRHMHNNILQVSVETGWLGLAVYLWWMISALLIGVRILRARGESRDPALVQIGIFAAIALLGWQCAGVVEYNFGDAEVRFIALLYMGILLAVSERLCGERLCEEQLGEAAQNSAAVSGSRLTGSQR